MRIDAPVSPIVELAKAEACYTIEGVVRQMERRAVDHMTAHDRATEDAQVAKKVADRAFIILSTAQTAEEVQEVLSFV